MYCRITTYRVYEAKALARLDEAEADELLGELFIRPGIKRCGRDGREALVPRHPVDETVVERVALRARRFVQRHIYIFKYFNHVLVCTVHSTVYCI